MKDPVKTFAKWVIARSVWQATDLAWDDVWDQAIALGLLRETTFNPSIHGRDKMDEFGVDEGDPWYELTELLTEP